MHNKVTIRGKVMDVEQVRLCNHCMESIETPCYSNRDGVAACGSCGTVIVPGDLLAEIVINVNGSVVIEQPSHKDNPIVD